MLWPEGTEWISGPASLTVFSSKKLPGNKVLYLFGDVHFSYRNVCSPLASSPDSTVPLMDIVSHAMVDQGAHLFIEYPYTSKAMRALPKEWRWYEDRLRDALSMDSAPSAHLKNVLSRLFGVPGPVTGMLSKLYEAFPYDHPNVHCIDIRSEPNVHAWDSAMHFAEDSKELYPVASDLFDTCTAERIRAWLNAFVHEDAFLPAAHEALSGLAADRYLSCKTLTRRRHPIRAKLTSLSPTAARQAAEKFADATIADVVTSYRRLRLNRRHARESSASCVRQFVQGAQVALMDIYAVCCILEELHSPNKGPLIVYAGDYHTQAYQRFIKQHFRIRPTLSVPMSVTPRGGVQRCLRVRS
jgi:hypothetical protein